MTNTRFTGEDYTSRECRLAITMSDVEDDISNALSKERATKAYRLVMARLNEEH